MPDSTVQFINIDEEFPIAGQDNDSQGFRDNFSEIKQALVNTNLELTDLLTNSARLDNNNNFNGNEISNANLLGVSHEVSRKSVTSSGTNTLSWSADGEHFVLTVTGESTITLTGWGGNDKLCKMRLVLATNGGTFDVTFSTSGQVRIGPSWPTQTKTITIDSSTAPIVVDAWTSDNGAIVYLDYVGKFTSVA